MASAIVNLVNSSDDEPIEVDSNAEVLLAGDASPANIVGVSKSKGKENRKRKRGIRASPVAAKLPLSPSAHFSQYIMACTESPEWTNQAFNIFPQKTPFLGGTKASSKRKSKSRSRESIEGQPLSWKSIQSRLSNETFVLVSKRALLRYDEACLDWSQSTGGPPGGEGVLRQLHESIVPRLRLLKHKREKQVAAERLKYDSEQQRKSMADNKEKKSKEYWASGTGYGGTNAMQAGDMAKSFAAQDTAQKRQQEIDNAERSCLEQALGALQSSKDDSLLYHPVLCGVLLRDLVPICAQYLNTSFEDICERTSLFTVLLHFISFLAKQPGLQHVLRVAPDEACGDSDDEDDTSAPPPPSISELLRGLSQQASLVEASFASVKRETKEIKAIRSIAAKIRSCCDYETPSAKKKQRLSDAVASISNDAVGASKSEVDLTSRSGAQIDSYCSVLSSMRLQSVPLLSPECSSSSSVASGSVHFSYHYRKEAANIKTSVQKRLRRIGKELAALSNSLPITDTSSILICVDESRPDCLKAMIVGPAGTPYENGLFEFDILLPASYPSSPPKVTLVTTGSGLIRFNPNLYKNGKVCLSLLGTWRGPGWHPKCTLLQVLISIQSLIFVDKPYFNEPGFEKHQDTDYGMYASSVYNQRIREATIRYAMIPHLLKPDASAFSRLIREHFARRSLALRAQTMNWLRMLRRATKQIKSGKDQRYQRHVFEGGVRSSTNLSLQAAVDELNTQIDRLVAERGGALSSKCSEVEADDAEQHDDSVVVLD